MGLIALVCPQCGAKLDVEDGREFYFCQYCGCKIVHEKQKVELSGTVNVAGMATEDTLLEKAAIQLRDGNISAAESTFERVLDINPRNAEAYLGKLMAELGITTVDELEYSRRALDTSTNYDNAMRYGTKEQREQLSAINDRVRERLIEQNNKRIAAIENERRAEEYAAKQKKKKKLLMILVPIAIIVILIVFMRATDTTNYIWIVYIVAIVAIVNWIKNRK